MSLLKTVTVEPPILKVLAYGLPKSGKTQFALSFPHPAIIDTEAGSRLFVGRPGLETLPTVNAQSLAVAAAGLEEIKPLLGKSIQTVIVDSISILYDDLIWQARQDQRNGNLKRVSIDQWDQIHARLRNFMAGLAQLPAHVVVTAQETWVFETREENGRQTQVRTGEKKLRADPLIAHWPDIILQFQPDRTCVIKAMRGRELKNQNPVANFTYERLMRQLTNPSVPSTPPAGGGGR